MTARERILQHCPEAQIVMKAHMTTASLNDNDAVPDYDRYAFAALEWWESAAKNASELGLNEREFAQQTIQRLREMEGWSRLLRQGTN